MDASTTGKRTRTEQCQRNAQAKSERKRQTAFEALALLQQEGKVVTKAAIAKRAGVSVVFLRTHPDLVQAIEEAEQTRLRTPPPSSPDRTKDQVIAALRRRLDEMKHALGKKDAELCQKQREIDRLYGKLAAGSVQTDPELRSALVAALERLMVLEEHLATIEGREQR
jgi:tRNA U34 5-carboxymethylaminomethyl modifying GTPase MnmE/TrmE